MFISNSVAWKAVTSLGDQGFKRQSFMLTATTDQTQTEERMRKSWGDLLKAIWQPCLPNPSTGVNLLPWTMDEAVLCWVRWAVERPHVWQGHMAQACAGSNAHGRPCGQYGTRPISIRTASPLTRLVFGMHGWRSPLLWCGWGSCHPITHLGCLEAIPVSTASGCWSITAIRESAA